MNNPIFSVIASAHRVKDWMTFYNSIRTNLSFEVIFVGEKKPDFPLPENFTYIYSEVKPTQCAEIALRRSRGTLITWSADDAEYEAFALDKAYDLYKKEDNYKCMIGFRIIEQDLDGRLYDKTDIHFCVGLKAAPFGIVSKQLIDEVGGFDINFIAGQCENDLVLRGYEIGGYMKTVDAKLFNMETKHEGERRFEPSRAYEQQLLKDLWTKDGKYTGKRAKPLEPFNSIGILNINQGPAGIWSK